LRFRVRRFERYIFLTPPGRVHRRRCLPSSGGSFLALASRDNFGKVWFLGPLSAYAADLAQPNLTEFGRQFLRSRAVRDLVRRLRVLETLRERPEIAAVPIPPIVYITGLERSGTTLLHNLLALHRDARVLCRWELLEPVPPPESATYDTDARIARVQGQADVLRVRQGGRVPRTPAGGRTGGAPGSPRFDGLRPSGRMG
jgi:hypothetical protein